jgi:hypothetical protein
MGGTVIQFCEAPPLIFFLGGGLIESTQDNTSSQFTR